MRVPLSWLLEFTDCALPVEEIARRLTLAGLEVEGIERIGVFSRDVIVGAILGCTAHPRSDQLRIVELDLGAGRRASAVTGAPNIAEGATGARVPVALPGGVLIDPKADGFDLYEVGARPVLGVESSAVLCSEKELGLSEDHSGVLVLDPGAEPGTPVIDHRPPGPDALADIVLEIAILPSQGRCLSIIGVARELAAVARSSFRISLDAEHIPLKADAFDIEIRDPDLCPRYSGYVLEGLSVKPSPLWMQRRLVLAGHKPYNNLVDVTNYILAELGQPMHAFDLDRLPARNIIARRARPGETMYTLDQKLDEGPEGEKDPPRVLDDSVLLITSADEPVAVGGVIGGLESQIHEDTTNILLEAASFDPISIRRTMSLLKVTTESSVRFSRGVDPALTLVALQRAAHLLKEIAGARPAGAIADRYPRPREARRLEVRRESICRTLGMDLPAEEISSALARLGFEIDAGRTDEETIAVGIPGFRSDVEIAADVAEEVIRVIGFDRLPARRLAEPLPRQRRSPSWEIRFGLRDRLVGAGLQDTISYSLTTPAAEKPLLPPWRGDGASPPYVEILNPASRERTSMRRTLLSGLMEAVARNHRHR
ncbi:MAG: phenylalanine--tRNA ligase subunit beta, partial [Planctomycetes bacterium]|nr:phenylalanine--tRNA ligase subunit beta [Planctomycetota bacterium]